MRTFPESPTSEHRQPQHRRPQRQQSQRRQSSPPRLLVLWCPDWPVVAAAAESGISAAEPAAVLAANRVVACSAVARAAGIRRGMRRREAQARCPELAVFADYADRDARLFETVATATEELIVGVEVVRPGVVAVPVAGAARYFGGERTLLERLVDHVSARTGAECQVGVSEGLFAATLAAHRARPVPAGAAAEFLAPLGVQELDQPGSGRGDLVDLLRRLGIRTLGAFAQLAERDVLARFGADGVLAHRLASGRDERPPGRRRPAPDLAVTETCDPPLERVDAAAFLARTLASRFHAGLAARGLACTRLGIHATTEHGEELGRSWRCGEPLTPDGIADRVRWQFEGWLTRGRGDTPTSGVTVLRLEPEETVEGSALQLGLWAGGSGAEHTPEADKAARALVHVQGLIGPEGVCTAVFDGGRGPAEQVRLVPWGDRRTPADGHDAPWPQRLPSPSPATVFEAPCPAVVAGEDGRQLDVTDRHRLTAWPWTVAFGDGRPRRVQNWAGPWPVTARWWVPGDRGRCVRLQVVLESGSGSQPVAVLLRWQEQGNPKWTVEGVYD
ncbi:DNA polymerase Y family protein [Prauserella salsuginis]|uniref:DNA polymerase Y family protein n=1 Tax=Prauserella salsuginis group TaxID=2893672 RepID=UPI003FD73362|nr:protein ImuB [Prauserella flava]MCR3736732.1 protein ImuB [Prauserella salsuginis]